MTGTRDDAELLVFRFFTEVGIIDQLATTALERMLPKGITSAQFAILNHFVRLDLDVRSPAELADVMQVTRATMSSTLKRMEMHGLIRVEQDPEDGRAKLVRLSQKGRDVREACVSKAGALASPMLKTHDQAQLIELTESLHEIRQALERLR
ncbi:MarR family winged helix-turn-helix transcriptional regulator [Sphingorhabdus pulchriflava]|nr:MarR family transcriptional regulator [Sphingorhabdus pulchriflava]